MRINRRARLDASQVRDRRGVGAPGGFAGRGGFARRGGPGLAVGGGAGGLLMLVLVALGIVGSGAFDGGDPVTDGVASTGELGACERGADVRTDPDCRFVAYVNSIQAYWDEQLPGYRPATTTVFDGAVRTGCGQATSAVGPFYCPPDGGVYLDLGFFADLESRFGGGGGDFAEAYVLAHEYGHHVQSITGASDRVRTREGPDSDAVRLELQADCYAGVWTAHATTVEGADGRVLILDLTREDISEGLDAARVVGDDYIQERFEGSVNPETWTHGSSEQRQRWFLTGMSSADPAACDTFAATKL